MLSTTLMVLCFAGMQMFRQQLGGAEYMTIVGGFIGSIVFILVLTVSFQHFTSISLHLGFLYLAHLSMKYSKSELW
jgi:hypothetical protein